MAKVYTTKTASLRAVSADVRQVTVNKKIEIGSVVNGNDGKPVQGSVVESSYVSADDLYMKGSSNNESRVKVTDYVASSIKEAEAKIDGKIEELQNRPNGIEVGTDETAATPEDDNFLNVSKLNFRGSYVTVVQGDNGELTLWINQSSAYPEYNAPSYSNPSTASYAVFSCAEANNDFAIGTTEGATKAAYVVDDGSNFGSTTYTLKAKDGNNTFRVKSGQAIFIRTTYEGTASEWLKVSLASNAGKTYDVNKKYEAGVTPFVSGSHATATLGAITASYSAYQLTDNEAEYGRIPGSTEAEASFVINWDTLLTKDGGTATVEFAIDDNSLSAPSVATTKVANNLYFSERKTPTMGSITAAYKTKTLTPKISGLEYATAGTTVDVTIPNIANTQWKTSNTAGNRLNINVAGTSVTLKRGDGGLTETGSNSASVYSVTNYTVAAGTSGNGTCSVSAKPMGAKDGSTSTNNTLLGFVGSLKDSTDTIEYFYKENKRLASIAGASSVAYDGTASVDTVNFTIPTYNVATVAAVAQYGSLKHPSKASADINGKTYTSVTSPASFIRKFTGSGSDSTANWFSVQATNLSASGVSVYWHDHVKNTWKLLMQNGVSMDANAKVSTGKVQYEVNTSQGEAKSTVVPIVIVMTSAAPSIGQVTFKLGATQANV